MLGTHGLSCRFSAGRHFCHAMLKDILHRALSSANVPSRLEPTGLNRADGKRPDGITMVPWSNGRLLVWDATCVDTFATSHLSITASEVCAAAIEPGRADQDQEVQLHHLPCVPFIHTCCLRNFWSHSMSFLTGLGSPHCEHHWGQKPSSIPPAKVFSCYSEGECCIRLGNFASNPLPSFE